MEEERLALSSTKERTEMSSHVTEHWRRWLSTKGRAPSCMLARQEIATTMSGEHVRM